MRLAVACNEIADGLPDYEKYGLASQVRRAAVSVPSNIAEGSGRSTDKDFARFLSIAYGSALELESRLGLIDDMGLADSDALRKARGEVLGVRRMVAALRGSLTHS